MFELVVLMTYLARAWKLLHEMSHSGYPIPYAFAADLKKLSGDLNAVFADPSHALNPVAVKLAEAEKAAEPVPVVVPSAPAFVSHECAVCEAQGVVKSKFMPYRATPCSDCGGTGQVTLATEG